MADQFAGQAIDIGPFYSKEFFAREVEDLRAMHYRNVDAFAIENIAVHSRPPVEALGKVALFVHR
jgi:hypothetical protein